LTRGLPVNHNKKLPFGKQKRLRQKIGEVSLCLTTSLSLIIMFYAFIIGAARVRASFKKNFLSTSRVSFFFMMGMVVS